MHDQVLKHYGRRFMTSLFAFMAVAGVGVWITTSRLPGVPYTILVDGQPIVNVESRSAAKAVLSKVRLSRLDNLPNSSVRFSQNVALRRASKDATWTDVPEAVRALEKAVTVEAELFAITVNGKPVVALAGKDDAEEALRLVKRRYESKVKSLYEQSTFKEQVFIDKQYVELEKLRSSPEEAAEFLTSVAGKSTIHTMRLGDRAVKLAEQYGVSLSELKKLNPQLNLDKLVEGDQLLIRVAKPPVTVISKALIAKTITVNPPPEARRYARASIGKRRIRLLITYENGTPVNEEVLSQITTWERPNGVTGRVGYGANRRTPNFER